MDWRAQQVMFQFGTLLTLLLLGSCAFQWYYEGPDISARTIGPLIVSNEQMNNACEVCKKDGCYGCMRPDQNVIYLRLDATRNYMNLCRLPDLLPETSEEHEWCHARGWRHN